MPKTGMGDGEIEAIADRVEALFAVGNTDPRFDEIHAAMEAHDGSPDLSIGVVLGALCDVKAELEDRGFNLCLVADPYYDKYEKGPRTEAQARDCLPMGHGKQGVGLRVWESDDIIAEAWEEEVFGRAAGMMSANIERCVKAVEDNRMEQGKAVKMLGRAFSKAGEFGEDGQRVVPKPIRRRLIESMEDSLGGNGSGESR